MRVQPKEYMKENTILEQFTLHPDCLRLQDPMKWERAKTRQWSKEMNSEWEWILPFDNAGHMDKPGGKWESICELHLTKWVLNLTRTKHKV